VALGHGQPLHGGELMRSRRVGDLQRADVLVAADYLSVRVLDGRYVRFAERALDKPEHQRAFAHAARPENHHSVIVALFRHYDAVSQLLQQTITRDGPIRLYKYESYYHYYY